MFVEIPWETVSAKLGDAYRELGKGVALKGFRKGKVPRPVLEQVYGQRVNAEVAYELVRESFFKATKEHNLAAVAEPRVAGGGADQEGPAVHVQGDHRDPRRGHPAGLQGPADRAPQARRSRRPPSTRRSRSSAASTPSSSRSRAARITAAGDIVGLSVTGTIGEHQINQPQFAVDLDDDEREPLPGMREALIGLPIDTKDKSDRDRRPRRSQGRADPRPQGRADGHDPRGRARRTCPRSTTSSRRTPARPTRSTASRPRSARSSRTRSRTSIDREAREGVLRELIKKNQIPVASSLVERAVEMQYQRLRQMLGMKPERGNAGPDRRPAREDAAGRRRRGPRPARCSRRSPTRRASPSPTTELDEHIEATAKTRNMAPAKLRAEWQRDGRLDNVTYSLRQDKVLDVSSSSTRR